VLSLKRVDTRYGGLHVLKGVSLEVSAGEIVTLVGANGAGKTTLLWAISGFVIPFGGEIEFLGQGIRGLSPEVIVRMGISQVPEGRAIFPVMTVLDNLEMGAYVRRDKKEIVADLRQVYELFPILKERKGQLAGTLSGGEQQMLAIARGLMSRPRLFLLDEPSLGLAPLLVEAIGGIIGEIKSRGVTILLVEQNVNMALQMASRGYVLEIGKIVLEGTGEELLNNDMVKKAYLGL
jgi:branched-chain amino acid transport system ATP-binding protein